MYTIELTKRGNELVTLQFGSVVPLEYGSIVENSDDFDTSVRGKAQNANICNSYRNSILLQVVTGQHYVILDFEESLKNVPIIVFQDAE